MKSKNKKADLVIAIGMAADNKSKKKKKMNVGGMMPTPQERKINPTTGMSMNKGGMTDMRKTGMFYGGGMARKKK
tara:strand:- start:174 stop:398 length:225 start_codon:yes stop_codon:yes gene_type:complete